MELIALGICTAILYLLHPTMIQMKLAMYTAFGVSLVASAYKYDTVVSQMYPMIPLYLFVVSNLSYKWIEFLLCLLLLKSSVPDISKSLFIISILIEFMRTTPIIKNNWYIIPFFIAMASHLLAVILSSKQCVSKWFAPIGGYIGLIILTSVYPMATYLFLFCTGLISAVAGSVCKGTSIPSLHYLQNNVLLILIVATCLYIVVKHPTMVMWLGAIWVLYKYPPTILLLLLYIGYKWYTAPDKTTVVLLDDNPVFISNPQQITVDSKGSLHYAISMQVFIEPTSKSGNLIRYGNQFALGYDANTQSLSNLSLSASLTTPLSASLTPSLTPPVSLSAPLTLQGWNTIAVIINDAIVDVVLNGKLVSTTHRDEIPKYTLHSVELGDEKLVGGMKSATFFTSQTVINNDLVKN